MPRHGDGCKRRRSPRHPSSRREPGVVATVHQHGEVRGQAVVLGNGIGSTVSVEYGTVTATADVCTFRRLAGVRCRSCQPTTRITAPAGTAEPKSLHVDLRAPGYRPSRARLAGVRGQEGDESADRADEDTNVRPRKGRHVLSLCRRAHQRDRRHDPGVDGRRCAKGQKDIGLLERRGSPSAGPPFAVRLTPSKSRNLMDLLSTL